MEEETRQKEGTGHESGRWQQKINYYLIITWLRSALRLYIILLQVTFHAITSVVAPSRIIYCMYRRWIVNCCYCYIRIYALVSLVSWCHYPILLSRSASLFLQPPFSFTLSLNDFSSLATYTLPIRDNFIAAVIVIGCVIHDRMFTRPLTTDTNSIIEIQTNKFPLSQSASVCKNLPRKTSEELSFSMMSNSSQFRRNSQFLNIR